MKPNLPIVWFDYAVIPEHDGILSNERVIVTRGALNQFVMKTDIRQAEF